MRDQLSDLVEREPGGGKLLGDRLRAHLRLADRETDVVCKLANLVDGLLTLAALLLRLAAKPLQ